MSQVDSATMQLDPKLLLKTLRAFRRGEFSARLPSDMTGIDGEIAEAFNDIAELNQGLARELDRVAKVVGNEGRIGERGRRAGGRGGRAGERDGVGKVVGNEGRRGGGGRRAGGTGCWNECVESVNS